MDELDKIRALLEKPLEKAGYELAEVKLSRDKDGLTLHVSVDGSPPSRSMTS